MAVKETAQGRKRERLSRERGNVNGEREGCNRLTDGWTHTHARAKRQRHRQRKGEREGCEERVRTVEYLTRVRCGRDLPGDRARA